jgi:homoserine kinase type II
MNTVFNLWFEREYPDREDTALHIGIYATRDDAEAAIAMLKDKPGFCNFPEGFGIDEVTLGHTGWQEGFVTEYIAR